jgi:hypothetical protein
MLVDHMEKTLEKWRRDAEKRRKRSAETPEEARERAKHEIDRMVKRANRLPKSDEDLRLDYEQQIKKLKKRSIESRARADADKNQKM